MRDIALRNRTLDRNDGRNVKRSAYVSGSGRDFCDGELNYTGCEQSHPTTKLREKQNVTYMLHFEKTKS